MTSTHRVGLMYGLAGIVIICPDGLLIRLAQVDQPTLLAMRGLFGGTAMLALFLAFGSRKLPRGKEMIAAVLYGLLFGAGLTLFVKSMQATELANTLVILSSAPLVAAILAAVILHERIARRTWIAAVFAVLAAGMVFLATPGAGFETGYAGQLYACANVMMLSFILIIIRKFADADIVLGAAAGSILVGLVYLPDAVLTGHSATTWMQLALLGFVTQGAAFWLINRAARYLPPPEVSLLFLVELAFGPLLVWLFVGEEVDIYTIVAGVVMTLVFVIHSTLALRDKNS